MEMLEVMNLIKANVTATDLANDYYKDNIEILFESLKKILETELYLFSLSSEEINLIYLWVEYFRYNYSKKNLRLINDCNELISLLNKGKHNIQVVFKEIPNTDPLKSFEMMENVFSKVAKINNSEKCFNTIDQVAVYDIWITEYYLVSYLLDGKLNYDQAAMLIQTSNVELAIISVLNSCLDTLTYNDMVLIVSLLKIRAMNFSRDKFTKDGRYVYKNAKEFKNVILKIARFLKDYDKPKILEKDK